jgi:hypothetical protein
MGYRGGSGTGERRQVARVRRRSRIQALAVAALATLPLASLAACSVPREADLATATSQPASSVPAAPAATSAPPTGTASPTPSPSPSASPRPVTAPPARRVAGYVLSGPPRGLGDPLEAVRGAGDLFGAVTVRSVAQGDTPVGVLFLFAVRPQYLDDQRVSSLVLPKVVAGVTGGGIPVSMQKYGTQRVAVGSSATKGTIVLWYDAGVLAVVVGGGAPATVTGYARAYVARR